MSFSEFLLEEDQKIGVVNDLFGSLVGSFTPSAEVSLKYHYHPLRYSGYGPFPGHIPKPSDAKTSLVDALGWRGKRIDPTGLYWMGARYYDPQAGRFISADPLGHGASMSLYDYCGGDPINYVDADGRLVQAGADMALTIAGGVGSVFANSRVQGGLRVIGGVAETAIGYSLATAGAAASTTGIGAIPGVPAALGGILLGAHGADQTQAGLRQLFSGESTDSFSSERLQDLGLSRDSANLVDSGISMVGSFGGGLAANSMRSSATSSLSYAPKTGVGWKPTPFNVCFAPGTQVLMADGSTKAIEEVKEGEEVLAQNPETDAETSARRVTQVHRNWTLRFIHVSVDEDGNGSVDGEVKATGEHPFWTRNRGWVAAKDLTSGDQLVDAHGGTPIVVSALSVPTESDTFNLSVEGAKTFFALAGDVALLVHNTEPFEIGPYGQLNGGAMGRSVLSTGVSFERHELLQNAWLKANGYQSFKPLNPSLAAPKIFHQQVIFGEQALTGLHNPSFLKGMSAYDNIRGNIAVLKASGVDRSVFADLANQARNFAKSLPCP